MMNMQYKGFVWPNNPKTYTLSCEHRTAVHKLPMGSFVVQDLGDTCLVLRGEGEFFGSGAYSSFQALLGVFQSGGLGSLYHPVWSCPSAYFTRLRLTQEPREDYVAYSFEFCQGTPHDYAAEQEAAALTRGAKRYHSVEGGQTLWTLCSLYDLRMAELTRMNPELSSPGGLTVGQKVRVG